MWVTINYISNAVSEADLQSQNKKCTQQLSWALNIGLLNTECGSE